MELNYLNLKADVNHTHTEYAVANHTHPEYENGGSGGGHGDNCVSKNQYESDKVIINELIASKASIGDLRATNTEINNLKTENAVISSLVASKADIVELNAQMAQIENLKVTKAEIKDLEAVIVKTDTLDANYGKINNLLAGNLTAGNIQAGSITSNELATGTITAGSGVIADGAIGNAQISSLDAGKISSGKIDTNKVEVTGADGHLRIKGNRLQVFQGTGNQAWERVSLGDVNGDGTAYGFRVRSADGKTVLLDENGVKAEGITNGIITNDKISDNADIDGAKLNINSVVTRINDDSSETIKGVKINVDGTNLETKLSDMTIVDNEHFEKIKENSSKITANENSIKLKVDSQTYENDKTELTSKMNKNTSEINLLKDEISLKVEQSDIDKVVDEVTDEIDEKVNSAKSEIKLTTDSITQQVSNLSTTVSSKADKSSVTTVSNKVSSLETNLSSISGKVSNLETTTDININDITGLKNEVKTVKSDLATLDVSLDGITQRVSSTEDKTNTLTTNVNNAQSTADSKAKIFTSTPVPPYKLGDLWVQGSTGEIMRCKTARSSGSYLSTDWEKASKYTDDTKANAVDNKVGTLQSTVDTTNSKVASLETNLSGITSRVSNVETKTTTLEGKVTSQENRLSTAESKITKDAIINTVSDTFTTKTELDNLQSDITDSIASSEANISNNIATSINNAKNDLRGEIAENYVTGTDYQQFVIKTESAIEQTNSDVNIKFENTSSVIQSVGNKLNSFQNTVETNIRFNEEGIDIGKSNSPFAVNISNEKMSFTEDSKEVAYISNKEMKITDAIIKNSLTLGGFKFVPRTTGNVSLVWDDGGNIIDSASTYCNVSNTTYPTHWANFGTLPTVGEIYTLELCGARRNSAHVWGIYNSGGMEHVNGIDDTFLEDGVWIKSFVWKNDLGTSNDQMQIYPMPHATDGLHSSISYVKMVRGDDYWKSRSNLLSYNNVYTNGKKYGFTSAQYDHYVNTEVYGYFEAGVTYKFTAETDGTWWQNGDEEYGDNVQAWLVNRRGNWESGTLEYILMETNRNGEAIFTPTTSGRFWLRLDINEIGREYFFWNFKVVKATSNDVKTVTVKKEGEE